MGSVLPLEDTFADILGKACRGLGLDREAAALRAGLSTVEAAAVFDGIYRESGVRALAKVLNLHPDRLAAIGEGIYRPAPIAPLSGFAHFNTPFDETTVNFYLAWDAKHAVVFDTGLDCDGMLETLKEHGLTAELILLTHAHGDHIYEIDRLKEKTGAPAWIGEKEPVEGVQALTPGRKFKVGSLEIESRSTWGHSEGGITYVVTGLKVPLAIVGDALFAGSMGGGQVSHEAALRTNRESIFTLPDETVICPGHGPLTTVGEQKKANPFFPEF